MKIIFSIIAGLIIYGSLYPFQFSFEPITQNNIQALFNLDIGQARFSDLVANVVLFIPFGLVLRAAYPQIKGKRALTFALMSTFIFAFAIQVLQLWAVGRLPWGGDAGWNVVGCWLGFLLYSVINLDAFYKLSTLSTIKKISFTLAILLVLLKLAPFAPTMDWQLLKDNIKSLLANPIIDGYYLFEYTLVWLVAFHFIAFAHPSWAHIVRLSLLVSVVLALKFIIISSNIHFSQLLAGALALCIWQFASTYISAKVLAGLMLLAILGNGLYPFVLLAEPTKFNWIPFASSLYGNFLVNIIALSTKLVFYGTTICLLYMITGRLRLSALLCLFVVLLSEFLQTMVANSIPDITDVVLVLFVVYVFKTTLKHKPSTA